MSHFYFDLSSPECKNANVVGGKAKGLYELISRGFDVPAGFVIPSHAFSEHLDRVSGSIPGFRVNVATAENDPTDEHVHHFLSDVRDKILKQESAQTLREALGLVLESLDASAPIVLRSSATVEDLETHSWAGQFETFLDIQRDIDVVSQKIKVIWASVFTPRVFAYAKASKFQHSDVRMAVIIQEMVANPDYSGVLFTKHPLRQKSGKMYAETVNGPGGDLVSGRANPTCYEFDEASRGKVSVARSGPQEGRISEKILLEVFKIGGQIEEALGIPQDIEWTVKEGKVSILQSRPITWFQVVPESSVSVSKEEVVVRGLPASPGVGHGRARIVFNINQASQMEQGEVLVAPMTNPDMVPYMQRASAIVTDVGGMICHTAIVAREMGIPCIVGSTNATQRIAGGEEITVDGNCGVAYKGRITAEGLVRRSDYLQEMLFHLTSYVSECQEPGIPRAIVPSCGMSTCYLSMTEDVDILLLTYSIEQTYRMAIAKGKDIDSATKEALSRLRVWYDQVSDVSPRTIYVQMPRSRELRKSLAQILMNSRANSRVVEVDPGTDCELGDAIWLSCATTADWPRNPKAEIIFLYREVTDAIDHRFLVDYLQHLQNVRVVFFGAWNGSDLESMRESCALEMQKVGISSFPTERKPNWELGSSGVFFGHVPELVEMDYPYPPRIGPWWKDNWSWEWTAPAPQKSIWANIRPEIVNTPLTKSLIVQGVESIPYILGFGEVGPLYTRWRKCRIHIEPHKIDRIRILHARHLASALAQVSSYIQSLHESYKDWSEATTAVDTRLRQEDVTDVQDLVSMFKSLWIHHERFFALCFLIQTIGDDLVWPKVTELVKFVCEEIGVSDADQVTNAVVQVLASPPEKTLSSLYLDSLRSLALVCGQKEPRRTDTVGSETEDAESARTVAVQKHLENWGWMRDRDLSFEPLNTASAIEEVISRLTDQSTRSRALHHNWFDMAEVMSVAYALMGSQSRFLDCLVLGLNLQIERENHHVIWVKNVHVMREIILRIAENLVERGVLSKPQDVFYLQIPEVFQVLAQTGRLSNDWKRTISNRKLAFMTESKQLEHADVETLPLEEPDYY